MTSFLFRLIVYLTLILSFIVLEFRQATEAAIFLPQPRFSLTTILPSSSSALENYFTGEIAQNNATNLNSDENWIIKDLKTNKILRFGIRLETYPVSYKDEISNEYKGFCTVFAQELKKSLETEFDIRKIELTQISIKNFSQGQDKNPRYQGVENKEVHIECGANTIPFEGEFTSLDKVEFSNYFLKTKIKLLIPTKHIGQLNQKPSELKVGVIEATTTKKRLASASQYKLITYKDKRKAIEDLKENKINAYASDSLLLRGILNELEKQENGKYILFPQKENLSITSYPELYGLAFQKGNEEFKRIVNDTLQKKTIKEEIQKLEEYDKGKKDYKPRNPNLKMLIIFSLLAFFLGCLFILFFKDPIFKMLRLLSNKIRKKT
ncbi:MAG: transporter substrate-binding domain-containing protein [Symploca sp. SIO2E9]|nr:transporter substrate-binding domain-containing protein [Symploca sp. SIO2E9]